MRLAPLALLALTAACRAPDASDRTGGGGKGPIDDAPWFDADHLLEVEIELAEADFAELRDQSRDFFEELSGDCTAEPFASPFTWFEGTATVDGERLEGVGVRKKGFLGSMSWDKPSLKIETDQLGVDQYFANGTERVTLNNNVQDPRLINQCLGYGVFAAAGIPAPRCSFARVTVNGEELGIYTHVEDVKKDFLRRHFDDDDGDLYEGTLSDFAPQWSGTFDPKTQDTSPDREIVALISQALDAPNDQLVDRLGLVVDLDAFYTFWAAETLLAHWDGYASNQNNFFVYRDPSTGLATFMPWGADQLFGDPWGTPDVFLTGRITTRLWATREGRDGYVDAMERLLVDVWDEEALHGQIDAMEDFLAPEIAEPEEWSWALDELRYFVEERRDAIEDGLDELRRSEERPELREPFCMEDLGLVTSDFDTEYGSLEYDDPFLHTATLTGADLPPLPTLGAIAGPGEYGEYIIATVGVNADWTKAWQMAIILPPGLGPGTYPVGFEFGTAYLVYIDLTDPYAEGEVMGLVMGEVRLDDAGQAPGEPVRGTVSGTLIGGLW